ncbi:anti-sigma-D factor RsdA [Rhodococcus sovatensis]|uniref:Anti-sigma-D factor RsdA n=1 Tax=Rhodococcus sovatensis TaxID=1805840 RepID=A0ABZ2PY40_9NOCA
MAKNNGRDGIPRIGRPDRSPITPSGGSLGDLSDTGMVDIAAVRRDDEFIEAIRGDGPVATDNANDYQLALLLTNWRAEICTPALPAGPDLNEVAAAVDQEIAAAGLRRKASGRTRRGLLRPVAGAAAAIALVMGGLVVFSYNSAPGDPLWSVKSVVFSEQADSTVAQMDTTSKLEEAEQLIASGDIAGAQALLDGASATSGEVIDQAQRTDLEIWLQRLMEQLQTILPTIPPVLLPQQQAIVPDPVLPEVPSFPVTSVPVIPPVQSSTDLTLPPVTSDPVSPPPTEAPVTTTSEPAASIMREPNPTTATASGSTDGGTSQSRIDTLDNGG